VLKLTFTFPFASLAAYVEKIAIMLTTRKLEAQTRKSTSEQRVTYHDKLIPCDGCRDLLVHRRFCTRNRYSMLIIGHNAKPPYGWRLNSNVVRKIEQSISKLCAHIETVFIYTVSELFPIHCRISGLGCSSTDTYSLIFK
jgi:hypothetical protein